MNSIVLLILRSDKMPSGKRYSNKELLEAVKYFLSMTYKDESGNFRWKVRETGSKGDIMFNSRRANKLACNKGSAHIVYNDKYMDFGLVTIIYVVECGKLPLGNDNNKLSIYPDTEENLRIYNEFLKNTTYNDEGKCFYWKRRKECDKYDKRFNKLHAGKKIKCDKKITCNVSNDRIMYQINLLHALWLLKKGVPSELPLYFIDKDKGLTISNISDE